MAAPVSTQRHVTRLTGRLGEICALVVDVCFCR